MVELTITPPCQYGTLLTKEEADEMAERISKNIVDNIAKQIEKAVEAFQNEN